MDNYDRLQIEMAASGCISGKLVEWPDLNSALIRQKIWLSPDTIAATLSSICKLILFGKADRPASSSGEGE